MPDTMRFAVDPLPGGSAAVGEEVSFREEGGKLYALNENGEPFGAVPGGFAALLVEDVRAGAVSAEVSSREDGRPVVSVAFGDAPAPGDGGRADSAGGDGQGDAPEPEQGDAPEPEQGDAPEPEQGDAPEPEPAEPEQEVAAEPQQPGPAEAGSYPADVPGQPAPAGAEPAQEASATPTGSDSEQGARTGARHPGAAPGDRGGRSATLADEAVAGAHASHAEAGDAGGSGSVPPDGGGGPSPLGEYHRKKDARTRNIVIAAVVAVVVVVLAVTFWPCSHEWADATCTEPATCTKCGETEGEALGHDWQEATCTEPKTCSRCGETEGDALGHTWTDATCTEPQTCSVCGETEGEALGHTVEEWTVDAEATCAEEGSEHGTCTVCGEEVTESIAKTDHTEGDWSFTEEVGYKVLTCSVCGEVMDTQEVSEIVSALQSMGMFETTTVSGSGDDVIELPVSDIPMIMEISYSGSRNFIVHTVDSSGDDVDLLVNTIGAYDGTVTNYTDHDDCAMLSIESSGSWSVTFKPMCLMGQLKSGETYSGDDVHYINADDLTTLDVTNSGDSNFVIWGIGMTDADLLVNEIGDYDGTVVWSQPQSFLIVESEGSWTVSW